MGRPKKSSRISKAREMCRNSDFQCLDFKLQLREQIREGNRFDSKVKISEKAKHYALHMNFTTGRDVMATVQAIGEKKRYGKIC